MYQLVNQHDTLKQGVKLFGRLRKDGTPSKRLQKMIFVNESGFYALVLGSKLPTAVKFKNWVTADVLPQIRKTDVVGEIGIEHVVADAAADADTTIKAAEVCILE